MEAQAMALIDAIWAQSADMISDMWPVLAFPVALAAVFAVGTWVRGLF